MEELNSVGTSKLALFTLEECQTEVRAQLQRFLTHSATSRTRLPRARLGNEVWTLYVRLNLRLLDGQACRCLDVASCEIAPVYQGRRLFSALMQVLQNADHAYEALYACDIQSPLVEDWCRRHGWCIVKAEPAVWPPSYYLLL